MATVMTMKAPITSEMYDRVSEEMDFPNEWPEGLMSHHAAKAGDEMIIFDVWNSQEDFERFQNERLMPAFEKIGGGPPPEGAPEPTFAELHKEFHR